MVTQAIEAAANGEYDFNEPAPWDREPDNAGYAREMVNGREVDPWDYVLPSVNQAKAAGNSFTDDVPDGSYQFAIVGMSPQLANNFKNKDGKPGKPRRAITFRVLRDRDAEDPDVVGLDTQQFYTESMHPKSALYPLVRAALGGSIDPDYEPTLRDLKDAQIMGSLITGPSETDPDKMVQRLQAILPAKKKLPVPDRRKTD